MAKVKKANETKIHFIGIHAAPLEALALIAQQLGYQVSGSDADQAASQERLTSAKITFFNGFDSKRLSQIKPDLVVVDNAYGVQNPEVKALKNSRVKVLAESELLAQLMSGREGVGVAGTHGKSTTATLLTLILQKAGFSPSYFIGSPTAPVLSANGGIGDGKHFVVEADDYRKSEIDPTSKFLDLPLKHLIVTSIELDHPDLYATGEQVYNAFYALSLKVPRDGTIVACTDWPLVRRLVNRRVDRPSFTYGFESNTQYQLIDYRETPSETVFKLRTKKDTLGLIKLRLPGRHNALNVTAAILMAVNLGVSYEAAAEIIATLKGPPRRFELLGDYHGAPVIADAAEHPTSIIYLLDAVRARYPGKVSVMVFQPHTYSRIGKLLKEYARSLQRVDRLILLNILAAAREKSGYVSIKDLLDEVKKNKPDVEYRPNLEEVAKFLRSSVTKDDVVLLVGVGNVNKIFALLKNKQSNIEA